MCVGIHTHTHTHTHPFNLLTPAEAEQSHSWERVIGVKVAKAFSAEGLEDALNLPRMRMTRGGLQGPKNSMH